MVPKVFVTISMVRVNSKADDAIKTIVEAIECGAYGIRVNLKNSCFENTIPVLKFFKKNIRLLASIPVLIDICLHKSKPRITIQNNSQTLNVRSGEELVFSENATSCNDIILEHASQVYLNSMHNKRRFYYNDGAGSFLITRDHGSKSFVAVAENNCILESTKAIALNISRTLDIYSLEILLELFSICQPFAVCVSFCETTEEIDIYKYILKNYRFFPKIETIRGIENIPYFIDQIDGIMLGRGDLLFSCGEQTMFECQEYVRLQCERNNVFSMVATDILDSLSYRQMPSRADLVDLEHCLKYQSIVLNAPVKNYRAAFTYINQYIKE